MFQYSKFKSYPHPWASTTQQKLNNICSDLTVTIDSKWHNNSSDGVKIRVGPVLNNLRDSGHG